jgi:hypothetical protein
MEISACHKRYRFILVLMVNNGLPINDNFWSIGKHLFTKFAMMKHLPMQRDYLLMKFSAPQSLICKYLISKQKIFAFHFGKLLKPA